MIKLFFATLISFACISFFCRQPDKPSGKATDNIKFNSYINFIDSVAYSNKIIFKAHKLYENIDIKQKISKQKNGVLEQNTILVDHHTIEKNDFFWNAEKTSYRDYSDSCGSEYFINGKLLPIDNLDCISTIMSFDIHYAEFGNQISIWGGSDMNINLLGPAHNQTQAYTIFISDDHVKFSGYYTIFNFDLIGLKFGDFNSDSIIDFLLISNDFNQNEHEYMEDHAKYQEEFYKITILSYVKGKWETLRDTKGKEYFMFIHLNKILDENSSGEVVSSNWF